MSVSLSLSLACTLRKRLNGLRSSLGAEGVAWGYIALDGGTDSPTERGRKLVRNVIPLYRIRYIITIPPTYSAGGTVAARSMRTPLNYF